MKILKVLETTNWGWTRPTAISTIRSLSKADDLSKLKIEYSKVRTTKEFYKELYEEQADIYWLAFHGYLGTLHVDGEDIKVQNIFRSIPDVQNKVVHFASCLTLNSSFKKRYKPFPALMTGYSESTHWVYSTATDIILLNLLALETPYSEIRKIMNSNKFLKRITGFRIRYRRENT